MLVALSASAALTAAVSSSSSDRAIAQNAAHDVVIDDESAVPPVGPVTGSKVNVMLS